MFQSVIIKKIPQSISRRQVDQFKSDFSKFHNYILLISLLSENVNTQQKNK